MAKNQFGTMKCPECGQPGAEVATDRSGNPYRVCMSEDCEGAQHFTHGKAGRVKNLLKATAPIAGREEAFRAMCEKAGIKIEAPAPAAPPKPAAEKPAAKKGWLADL